MGRAIRIRVQEYPKIRVLNNYVLIEPEAQTKTDKILLPEKVQESQLKNSNAGTVVAVGPGGVLPSGERLPLSVKVGDKVYVDISKTRGIVHEGQMYALCTEEAIMGVRE